MVRGREESGRVWRARVASGPFARLRLAPLRLARLRLARLRLAPRLALLWLALLSLAAPAGASELRRVEAVGAVAMNAARASGTPPRDAALQRGLFEAVRQVAADLVTTAAGRPEDEVLPEDMATRILGDDPLPYVTRFSILEDRGERPALFVEDPDAQTEYVVVAEVQVDVDRVRRRLRENGLLAVPSGDSPRAPLRVTVRGVERYDAFQAAREAVMKAADVQAATLVEASYGTSVLEVETSQRSTDVLNALLRQDRPGLAFAPLGAGETSLEVAVEWTPPQDSETSGRGSDEAPAEIDTPARKRY